MYLLLTMVIPACGLFIDPTMIYTVGTPIIDSTVDTTMNPPRTPSWSALWIPPLTPSWTPPRTPSWSALWTPQLPPSWVLPRTPSRTPITNEHQRKLYHGPPLTPSWVPSTMDSAMDLIMDSYDLHCELSHELPNPTMNFSRLPTMMELCTLLKLFVKQYLSPEVLAYHHAINIIILLYC